MDDNEFKFKISSAFLFAEEIIENPAPMDPGVIFENGRFNKYYFKRNFDYDKNMLVEDAQDPDAFYETSLIQQGTGKEYLEQGQTIRFIDSNEEEYCVCPPFQINSSGNLEFTLNAEYYTAYQNSYFLPMNNLNGDYEYIRMLFKVTYGDGYASGEDVSTMGTVRTYSLGSKSGQTTYMVKSPNMYFSPAINQGWVQNECYICYYQTYQDPETGKWKYRYVPMDFDFLSFNFSEIHAEYDIKVEINKIWCWNHPAPSSFSLDWWYNYSDDIPDIALDDYNYPSLYDGTKIGGYGKLPERYKDITDEVPFYWLDGADCSSSIPETWFRNVEYTIPLYTMNEELSADYKILVQFVFYIASQYSNEYRREGSLAGTVYIKLVDSNNNVLHYTTGSFGEWSTINEEFTFNMFGGADSFYTNYPDLTNGLMYICGVISHSDTNMYGGAAFPLSKLTEYDVKLGRDWFTPVPKSNIYFADGAYDSLNVPSQFNFTSNMVTDSAYSPLDVINGSYLSDVDTGTSFHITYSDYDLGDTVTIDPTYNSIRIRHWYDGTSEEDRSCEVYQNLITPILNIYKRYRYINIRYIIVTDSYEGEEYNPSNIKFKFYGREEYGDPPYVTELTYYECEANNQWVTLTVPTSDLYYTYRRGHADMLGIEMEYYHYDYQPFYLDLLVDKIWGSDEVPTPVPGPTPPTPPVPPVPVPEWWINKPGESPINVDGWEPFLGTYGWPGYYELTNIHEGSYYTGLDEPYELNEIEDMVNLRIPLVDSTGNKTTYNLRFKFPEDHLTCDFEGDVGLVLYNEDTLVKDWSLGESSYMESGYSYYFCVGEDSMNCVDYTQGQDPSLKSGVLYAFLIIVGAQYGGQDCVGYFGNAIDLTELSSRGLYLPSNWTTSTNE